MEFHSLLVVRDVGYTTKSKHARKNKNAEIKVSLIF